MADTVTLDPGAGGAVIATDDAGAGGQVQIIKLAISADGSATVIPADATVGLRVDPAGVSIADGGALPSKGVQIGGTDGSVFQVMSTDNAGRPNVNVNGAVDTELPAAAALADGAANPTAPAVGAFALLWNGATWDRCPGGATNGLTANLKALNGTTIDTNSGNKSAGTQRVVLATDQPQLTAALKVDGSAVTQPVSGTVTANGAVTNAGTFVVQENGAALTSLQLLDDTIIADDAAFTVATSKVTMAGFLADQASTDSVNEGDAGAARMTLDRKQIVTSAPSADTEGWDTKNCTAGDGSTALTNTAQAIKASAGKLGGWYIYNPNATAAYVPIYNVASGSVTVGTTNPLMVLTIPATSAANLEMNNGLTFDTAIAAAAATTAAGNTAPGTALEANFFFK